jgi:hypothetical protein
MRRRFEVRRNEFAGGNVMGSGNIENFAAFSSLKGAGIGGKRDWFTPDK